MELQEKAANGSLDMVPQTIIQLHMTYSVKFYSLKTRKSGLYNGDTHKYLKIHELTMIIQDTA